MTKRTVCVLAIALSLFAYGVTASAAAVKATLIDVKGNVFVQPAGGEFAPAASGMAVEEGATLKTGPDGSAILKWSGNTAKIARLTLITVDKLQTDKKGVSESKLNINQGFVVCKVEKLKQYSSFSVKTPAAIAGVRGTAFEAGINPETNQTTIAVAEGDVTVSAGGVDIVVAAGFESTISTGAAPEPPTEIPADKLQELKSTVEELKTVSEAAAPTETKAKPTETTAQTITTDKAVEVIQDNNVKAQTIENTVLDEAISGGCPVGGGCLKGTIHLDSGY